MLSLLNVGLNMHTVVLIYICVIATVIGLTARPSANGLRCLARLLAVVSMAMLLYLAFGIPHAALS